MKKACVFDLDGTLMNTISTVAGYANRALEMHGFAPYPERKYCYFVGNGAKVLVERMLAGQDALTEENYRKVYADYNRMYDAAPNEGSAPYPGIPELIAALKEREILTAVLSNKPDFAAREVVKTFFAPGSFEVVHGGREGVPLKPSAVPVLSVLEELGVTPEECLYIGDTGVDMQTGRGAGIFTVGVLWGFRTEAELKENRADRIIATPAELLSLL